MMRNRSSGRIHSIETLATLDGPGMRTVIFFQGCPLRCKFCHNVDSVKMDGGDEYTVDELFQKVIKNKSYWGLNCHSGATNPSGGITLSGGEPLLQGEFIKEFVQKLWENNIHTAVDTCLSIPEETLHHIIPHVDLWMTSIKHLEDEKHKFLTDRNNQHILKNLRLLDHLLDNKEGRIRVRYVIIPGLTDSNEDINKLIDFVKGIQNLESVELLPYRKIGEEKWHNHLGYYPLADIKESTTEEVEIIEQRFLDNEINCFS